MALETLLDRCDDTDRRLFFGLLRGEKPEALQQELFLSPSALRHREKNLMLWQAAPPGKTGRPSAPSAAPCRF